MTDPRPTNPFRPLGGPPPARVVPVSDPRWRDPANLEAGDFLAGRASTSLGSVVPSYRPGVTPANLADCLPEYAVTAMREALPVFGRQIKGYDHPDVVMTGVETRTSSPVRLACMVS